MSDSESGTVDEFTVKKNGEEVTDCVVLDPDNDDFATRAALKAYASKLEDNDAVEQLRERFDVERTPEETWEENNHTFNYDAPDVPPDMWSSKQYQEIHDRVIRKEVQWICEKCSQPFPSLKRARSHVQSNHGRQLLDRHAVSREEYEAATDGGSDKPESSGPSKIESRKETNHGLDDFPR